jgi:hypothetical protein
MKPRLPNIMQAALAIVAATANHTLTPVASGFGPWPDAEPPKPSRDELRARAKAIVSARTREERRARARAAANARSRSRT